MQYHKSICICLLLITCSISAYAQEEAGKKFRQFTLSLQPEYSRQQQSVSLQHFEAAYGWSRRKNRMFEVGLSNISASTQENYWYMSERLDVPSRNIQRSMGLNVAQYLYLRGADAHLQPYIAVSWATLLEYSKHIPGTLSDGRQLSYPLKGVFWINRLKLSPGIQYRFSNLLIKLEVPVTVVQTESSYRKFEHPSIPPHKQHQALFTPTYFPFEVVALELGIAYRINQ